MPAGIALTPGNPRCRCLTTVGLVSGLAPFHCIASAHRTSSCVVTSAKTVVEVVQALVICRGA